jgi:hypothetical protein
MLPESPESSIQAGSSETEIAKLLGHAATVRARRDTRPQPTHLRATADAINELLRVVDTPMDSSPLPLSSASVNLMKTERL